MVMLAIALYAATCLCIGVIAFGASLAFDE